MITIQETQRLLTQWGIWIHISSGAPKLTGDMELVMAETEEFQPSDCCITDDEGLMVDGVVARLSQLDPEMGRLVRRFYGTKDASIIQIARDYKTSDRRINTTLKAAEGWIAGVLNEKMAA